VTRRRVVITGQGLVTPLGIGVASSWEGLLAGRSGIGPVTRCPTDRTRARIAGEVTGFDGEARFGAKAAKRLALFSQYALTAAAEALQDAGVADRLPVPGERAAVALGVGFGGLPNLEYAADWYYGSGEGRIGPFFIPMLVPNMAAANLAIRYGIQGPSLSPAAACASGAQAVGEAYELVASGRADAALAGGAEATITPLALLGFAIMRALSSRNDEPTRASRPFDGARDGFVLAEGAGVLLLETLAGARRRGAPIHAEIVGYGATGDAHHLTASTPDGSGPARCMALALQAAGLPAEAVDTINAHATSTPDGDAAEAAGIRLLLGEARLGRVPVTAAKGALGHTLGAAGAIEAVLTSLSLERGVIPPILNLEDLGQPGRPGEAPPVCELGLDYVRERPRPFDGEVALSNSFGFGGTNACLVLRRWDERHG
jgi:3-oxoacyl-[acyl-carrier-protein] synthase II